ncbi:70 kDa neurofilament protein isoform X2 [Lingula anatina]|uniref:70 kDa neurofilament protein isoform X2 n=1 Tax=Lingula anatina TaxID=7574 RepID=A0A1S3JQM1_LINAN|nr:70 kDa neurofilament protein isoform X2 [Lingula anatina]|eukprot:XP_013412657.1 70 kDa neurofilament protein isoform X2 [Lingula anatina]
MSSSSVKITKKTESSSSSGGGQMGGGGGGAKTMHYESSASSSSSSYKPVASRHGRYGKGPVFPGIGAGGAGAGMSRQVVVSYGYGASRGSSAISSNAADNVAKTREREKQDMQDLNERFASYIEKVRFLEAQNRKLAAELENLKAKWGKETASIKVMFEGEMTELRKQRDDADTRYRALEAKLAGLEEQIEDLQRENADLLNLRNQDKDEIERNHQTLSDYESEINLLRRRVDFMERELDVAKKNADKWRTACQQKQMELDAETLARITAENEKQTAEEALEFQKQINDQEMKELAALAYRDTTQENREFWKSEMAQALREISQEYESRMDNAKQEMEAFYNVKIQEQRTGANRQNMELVHTKEEIQRLRSTLSDKNRDTSDLQSQIANLKNDLDMKCRELDELLRENELDRSRLLTELEELRAENEKIMVDFNHISDAKLSLELEIAAYRKLLEGEESREDRERDASIRKFITRGRPEEKHSPSSPPKEKGALEEQDEKGEAPIEEKKDGGSEADPASQSTVKGEMSAKTTFQRSAKGPITISEVDAHGNFIELENTSRKEENLNGWKIRRMVDGKEKEAFVLQNVLLSPHQKLKVFGHGKSGGAPGLESQDFDQWSLGNNIHTMLVDMNGSEKASHISKTTYS